MAPKTKPKAPKRLRRRYGFNTVSVLIISVASLCIVAVIFRPDVEATKPQIQIVNEDDFVMLPTPSRNVAKGESLGDVSFTFVKWPKSRATNDYVRDLGSLRDGYAVTFLAKAAPIPQTAVSSNASDINQVIEGIPVGMRAITVKVDAESAVEGWAQSGNYVDVILVRSGGGSGEGAANGGFEGKVIAENIKILSAGRVAEPTKADKGAPKPPTTVTLLTTQEDALKIKMAVNMGKITFSLRGSRDQGRTSALTMDQRSMLGRERVAAATPEIKGVAKGPDGRTYILGLERKWIESGSGITLER
jgi:pilus assembly protein CpaB